MKKLLIIVVAFLTVPSVQLAKGQPFDQAPLQLQLSPSERSADSLRWSGDFGHQSAPTRIPLRIDSGSMSPTFDSSQPAPLIDAPGAGYREQRDKAQPKVIEPL